MRWPAWEPTEEHAALVAAYSSFSHAADRVAVIAGATAGASSSAPSPQALADIPADYLQLFRRRVDHLPRPVMENPRRHDTDTVRW